MVQILPFAGWRFDLSQVGALSEVTAPATSLIDETCQRTLYRQHPCNAVRLVLNREEPGDTSPADRCSRADDFWRLWKREGILIREHGAAFYIVETTFESHGRQKTRWSVIARLQLSDNGASESALPTVVHVDADRIRRQQELRKTCQASLVPIVALLVDTTGADSDPRSLSDHLEIVVRQVPPVECYSDNGVRQRLWPLTNPTLCSELQRRFANFSLCVVGGHEEYLAAKAELNRAAAMEPNDLSRSVLACLIPADDAGLEFQPHLSSVAVSAQMSMNELRTLLDSSFKCQFVGNEPTACDDAAELARINSEQPCIAVGASDGSWMIVTDPDATKPEDTRLLIDRVCKTISEKTSAPALRHSAVVADCSSSLAAWSKMLWNASPASVQLIEPVRTSDDLLRLAESGVTLPASAVQLNPGVPTGLAFFSIQNGGA